MKSAKSISTVMFFCMLLFTPFSHSASLSDADPGRFYYDQQVEILKQKVWENLTKVAGTNRDYESTLELKISDGNIMDTRCKLIFPESSWAIASVVVDDYKDVLKNTSSRIFEVLYRLITDPAVSAVEIRITGLWRPFGGSHVHPAGRGMDFGEIRSPAGSGVIFNINTSQAENDYAVQVRNSLTTNFSTINEYFSPWTMCSPLTNCVVNAGVTPNERTHLNHMHVTLNP